MDELPAPENIPEPVTPELNLPVPVVRKKGKAGRPKTIKPGEDGLYRLREPLWTRQVGEPDRAWDGFRIYRDLDLGRTAEATITKLFEVTTADVDQIYPNKAKFSKFRNVYQFRRLWSWDKRVAAWDDFHSKKKVEQRLKAEMRILKIALLLQIKGYKKILAADPNEMTLKLAMDGIELGNKMLQDFLFEPKNKNQDAVAQPVAQQLIQLTTILIESREEKDKLMLNPEIASKLIQP